VAELGIQSDSLDKVELEDLAMQTTTAELEDSGVQTEEEQMPRPASSDALEGLDTGSFVDEGIQTDMLHSESPPTVEEETQTRPMDMSDAETMTFASSYSVGIKTKNFIMLKRIFIPFTHLHLFSEPGGANG
jgi:hypothetical protein